MTNTGSKKQLITVRLGTLRGDEAVPFDVYIRVGEKVLHYVRKDDPFDKERIHSLRNRKVQKLFIPSESEPAYLEYLDAGLGKIESADVSLEQKTSIAQSAMINIAENAEQAISTERGFAAMENKADKLLKFIQSEKGVANKILQESGVAQDDYQHASNVNTLAMLLAPKAGITDPRDLLNISVAALVHDMAKSSLALSPLIPREQLTPAELVVYQSHAKLSAIKLSNKSYINSAILSLVANHEEIGEGAGFPEKKRISTLPLTQQVLNLCNEYDRVCTVNKIPPLQAMKQFYLDKLGLFPLELVQKLRDALKLS